MGRWLVARADFCSEVCKISMEGNGGGSTSSHAVLWRQLVHSYQTGNPDRACQVRMSCRFARLNPLRHQDRVSFIHTVMNAALQVLKAVLSDSRLLTLQQHSDWFTMPCKHTSSNVFMQQIAQMMRLDRAASTYGGLISLARHAYNIKSRMFRIAASCQGC